MYTNIQLSVELIIYIGLHYLYISDFYVEFSIFIRAVCESDSSRVFLVICDKTVDVIYIYT